MIDGLKVEVSGEELYEHLDARVRMHKDKASRYWKQAAEVENLQQASGATNDPVSSLKQSATSHENRAELFCFIRDHLNTEETYRLADHDLARLELIGQHL